MSSNRADEHVNPLHLLNGAGAAALLSAGLGAFTLSVLAAIAGHAPAFKKLMIFYVPTGPLSGVTTTAIAVWLLTWLVLDTAWKHRNARGWTITAGLCLLGISFLLMFPPINDLF